MRDYTTKGIVVLLGLLAGLAVAAEPAATAPAKRFSVRTIPTLWTKVEGLPELRERWSAIRVDPGAVPGFCAVLLPFRVPEERKQTLEPLANALAFLLSYDLDWPDNAYCARHAYFVFKRDRELVQGLREGYTAKQISELVAGWSGTHGIGGRIDGTDADHLTGVLQVFGPNGLVLEEKRYDAPRPFAALLGDMAVDAMVIAGYRPSETLATLLHQPRCSRTESLTMLGSVAFLPERGDKEFGIYREILKQDPDFAEVRCWFSNQSYWAGGARLLDAVRSVSAKRPVASALADQDPWVLPRADRELYAGWCEHLEQMLGPQHPTVAMMRLRLARAKPDEVPARLDQLIQACRRNPHGHMPPLLLEEVVTNTGGIVDADLAISAMIMSMSSNAMPGAGFSATAARGANMLTMLGYGGDAVSLLAAEPDGMEEQLGERAYLRAMYDAGRFGAAVGDIKPRKMDDAVAVYLYCVNALAAGERQRATEALEANRMKLFQHGLLPLVTAMQDASGGKRVDLASLPPLEGYMRPGMMALRAECGLLLALRQDERSPQENDLLAFAKLSPANRMLAFLMAEYCARWKLPDCTGLAETWAWLHPRDPLNVRLQILKLPEVPVPETGMVQRLLRTYPPVRYPVPPRGQGEGHVFATLPPWVMAAAIRRLVERGDTARAEDLAVRYRHAVAGTGIGEVRMFANHLVYRVRAAIPMLPQTRANGEGAVLATGSLQ